LDKEERELQIRLAQLNAKLQASLAWIFGLYAASLVWFIFGYQVLKENFNVSILAWIASFVLLVFVFGWIHRAGACLREFKKLK